MFRRASSFEPSFTRIALVLLIGVALMLLTGTVANAAEPAVSTPSAWEYAYETAPAAERQPTASTAADLRLATGLSIAAVIVLATLVVGERHPDEPATTDLAPETKVAREPAPIRSLGPAEVLPKAA